MACRERAERISSFGSSSRNIGHPEASRPHPPQAVPLPHKARLTHVLQGEDHNAAPRRRARLSVSRRAKRCREARRGEHSITHNPAGRSPTPPGKRMRAALWGGLEGVRVERNPSTQFPARTRVYDGQRTFTRAARSAGLRFAVIPLSKALDRGNKVRRPGWHLIHRGAVPLPLNRGRRKRHPSWGESSIVGRDALFI